MTYLAKWFLKTGAAMLGIGIAFLAVQRKELSGSVPGDTQITLGKRSIRLPLGTGVLALILVTLHANIFGRAR